VNSFLPWLLWIAVTIGLIVYFAFRLQSNDQSLFLPGPTTDGHYQIELDCQACHTPMMGIKEQACLDCHGADLEAANDSHPKNKFTDPRNADRLEKLDARKCITCHIEHRPDQTHEMGLTLPEDYCFHCHEEIAKERPSHENYGFQSCANAGCHNFHDNSALYEDFLLKHLDEPDFKPNVTLPPRRDLKAELQEDQLIEFFRPLTIADANHHENLESERSATIEDWANSSHARAGVNCTDCHATLSESGQTLWTDTVNHTGCRDCHENETKGWMKGRHGMRQSRHLAPMTLGQARLEMKPGRHHESLSCNSCHESHAFNSEKAAVTACISCHDDDHSRAYFQSPHYQLWQNQVSTPDQPETGVSCATCHLPRVSRQDPDGTVRFHIEHNQNWNLEPNEKMIRSVCLQCHGLQFSIDSLADPLLIRSNFLGRPSRHIESLELARRRIEKTQK